MDIHAMKVELFEQYYFQLASSDPTLVKYISDKQWKNATERFAHGVDRDTVIGFVDTTVMGSGKTGYLFTDEKVCYLEILEKPKKLWYDEIESIEVLNSSKKNDSDRTLRFTMQDGTYIDWSTPFLNKTPLCAFFNELLTLEAPAVPDRPAPAPQRRGFFGAIAAGLGIGNFGTVNKLYDEEKFHAAQGHGFAAERANNLFDRLRGRNARILGDDNAKNGADRIVDGIYIQSKYCETGARCINECFENNGSGVFRYTNMQIEVPSDVYEAAVTAMEKKIENGQVPGVTDPEQARNIVRKGHFTYAQAKNIAKAGTVESLTYDAANGAIYAASAFGVTAMLTFAVSIWNGEDAEASLKMATYSGLKVGGTVFATAVLSSQLSQAGLNSALVGGSESIVRMIGPKASNVLISAFHNGAEVPIYGAAAMKHAAKLLRGNVITTGATVVVLSTVDIADMFRGRISGKQLFKNFATTTGTVVGGTGGWLAGSAIGSAVLPGVGTVIGGLIGSMAGGGAAGKAVDKVAGAFIEDDAEEMVEIIQAVFGAVANEYLLNRKEAEKCVDQLGKELSGKLLKDMFAQDDREHFARELIVPIVEKCVASRPVIATPSTKKMIKSLRALLEDIADEEAAMVY